MPPTDQRLSINERIDAACKRFAAEWKAGKPPRIDDILAAAPESTRDKLRQALLALEVELKGRSAAAETTVAQDSVRSQGNITQAVTVNHVPSSQPSVTQIGRFEIRSVLGAGGFGRVYRAYDPQLGREVAIKVPLAETVQSAEERAQFLKEARSAANINHPNVCQVHEVGEADGRPYIVMAMVRGSSLVDTLNARSELLPQKQAALIIRKIALALATAHDQGIVHRDLKPANVMFDRERKDIVVMDFGLARGPKFGDVHGTQSGVIMGTPAYMSPEQARGDSKGVGPAGDIFSLGIILYELLTGMRPFTGTATEVIGKILHVNPEKPSSLRPGIDPRLEAICMKAMAKDPAARFASMREIASSLDGFLRAPTGASTETARTDAVTTRKNSVDENDEAGTTAAQLAEVFAAIQEVKTDRKKSRKRTEKAIERAIKKHGTQRWGIAIIGVILALGLAAVGGIIFFTRSDKVKVDLAVVINDVDLKDKTLSFFLDDEPIPAEKLANPVELKPGVHSFTVKRGKEIVKRVEIRVAGGKEPSIKVEVETKQASSDGFIPLFNGKDLTGWATPDGLGGWTVEDGYLTGRSGLSTHLFSERSDFSDFHLRLECRINKLGDSGIFFRSQYDLKSAKGMPLWPQGYEAQIVNEQIRDGAVLTGSIIDKGETPKGGYANKLATVTTSNIKPDEWFTMEVIARGKKLVVKVNGVETSTVENEAHKKGRFALQALQGKDAPDGTKVQFRNIEIKELPAEELGSVPTKAEKARDPRFVEWNKREWKKLLPASGNLDPRLLSQSPHPMAPTDAMKANPNEATLVNGELKLNDGRRFTPEGVTARDAVVRVKIHRPNGHAILTIRSDPKTGYGVDLDDKGWVSVGKIQEKKWFELGKVQSAIPGDNIVSVAIAAIGDRITVFVDELEVWNGTDATFGNAGTSLQSAPLKPNADPRYKFNSGCRFQDYEILDVTDYSTGAPGFLSEFNGTDLTGFRPHSKEGQWTVSDGNLNGNADSGEIGLSETRVHHLPLVTLDYRLAPNSQAALIFACSNDLVFDVLLTREQESNQQNTADPPTGGLRLDVKDALVRAPARSAPPRPEGEWSQLMVDYGAHGFVVRINGEVVQELTRPEFRAFMNKPVGSNARLTLAVFKGKAEFRNFQVRRGTR